MKTRRTALSRIELLVVIVIIVLIPSILMASLEATRELAKIPVCANQLRQIGRAVSLYAERYDGNMPWWGYYSYGGEEMHPYVAYRADNSDWIYPSGKLKAMRLACLYEAGLITNPKIFYCPAMREPRFMFESYINPPPWGHLPQYYNTINYTNQWVRFGYTYYPTDPNSEMFASTIFPGLMVPIHVARRMDNLDPNIPYLTDMIHSVRNSLSHNIQGKPGVNALFKDGHVVYCDDSSIFTDDVWLNWEHGGSSGSNSWRDFYYMVFKLIRQSCGPAE